MNPPDHPTPRTNAIAHRGYPEPAYIVEMTDLARTLERELTETERLRFGADADRRRLRAEVERLKIIEEKFRQSPMWDVLAIVQTRNNWEARAEKAEADNAKWQKLLLMSRDDREIDLISEVEEQARLLGMSADREADLLGKLGRLESELAAIKHGHGELGKYEQLRLKNAELQAALAFIAEHGGTKHETECGTISCNGLWCAEQARAAMKGTP